MWDEIYERIVQLVNAHRSTLVFVNTRRLAERISHQLGERLGEENVAAHHGSLSRKLRLEAERKLKEGQVKVLVATASLELGIDVGTVDLVCHISSPRSIAVALQRVGRSGHWRGAVPKGRFFVTTRDDLAECAVLVRAIHRGELDRLIFPEASLDVLAQQIVACCAASGSAATANKSGDQSDVNSNDGWDEDELFALVKRAYPYRNLTRETFDAVLAMLSEGIASQRGRYGAYLHHDRINHKLRARRGARLAAITSGGAIPDNALFTVVAEPEGVVVGTVDEDFAVESMAGEVMLLGNTSWRIRRIEGKSSRILVESAHGAPPGIPFWRGEAPARTAELSAQLGDLRKEISDRLPGVVPTEGWRNLSIVADAVRWLREECGLDLSGAEQLIQYTLEGRAVLGDVPTQQTIIAERFFDEGGGMQLDHPRALWRTHQQSLGTGLAQAFLPRLQFRIAGGGHRQRVEHRARRAAQFSAGRCFSIPGFRKHAADPGTGGAGFSDISNALAVGRDASPGSAAFSGRQESSAADSAHTLRRFAGFGVPRCGGVLREHRRRHQDSRPSTRRRGHERRAHRGAGYRRPPRSVARNRAGTDSLPGRGHAGAVAIFARDSQCESVCLPGRCAPRRAPGAGGRNAARVAGVGARRSRRARSRRHRAGAARIMAGCARRG